MVPFVDLLEQYRALRNEIDPAVMGVLQSGQFVLGPAVESFEHSFTVAYGLHHAVACSSGTAALHLALKALDIGAGDEVITTSMTFVATASAIELAGATPILVDIEPNGATIDPDAVRAAITPRTKAIIPVHLYGQCADMDPLLEVARQAGVPIIEDAAQAHGAKYGHRFAGTMGEISCFSFYPGKNLGAYGEGGLVATGDAALATKLRMLRDWGQDRKYHHQIKGYNYRMDSIQGAILGVKMKYIEDWTEKRRQIARWYGEALQGISQVEAPLELPGRRHVWHIYGVRVAAERRAKIIETLSNRGIGTGLHYPVPVHLQPCFAELGHRIGDLPLAERQANAELSLPMYPEMTQAQVGEVADALAAAV
jgi:dTDP-4-amino-4,6-dideoxygalactose transaminase